METDIIPSQAMILAAGLGTRLRPLTLKKPKALVCIKGTPVLEMVILKLKSFGVSKIVINTHYLAEQILEFLKIKNNFGIIINISQEEELLDTGGAIKKAANLFDRSLPFILHNVDIVSDINLLQMYDSHLKNNSLATLAVSQRKSNRALLFNHNNILCGWEDLSKNKRIITNKDYNLKRRAFSGVHVISPEFLDYFPNKDNFSIIKMYLELSTQKKISSFEHNPQNWVDIGTMKDIEKIQQNNK